MKKHYLWLLVSLLLITGLLWACEASPSPEIIDIPSTYYNDYLGLSINVPAGWQINSLSENLAIEPGQTAQPQLITLSDGSGRLELLDIENMADSRDSAHCRFYAYGDIFPTPLEAPQYIDLFLSLLPAQGNPYSYSLLKQEQLELARYPAQRICLQVEAEGFEQPYEEEYYIVQLGTAFVVFYINYWPQEEASLQAAQSMLNNISLPAP